MKSKKQQILESMIRNIVKKVLNEDYESKRAEKYVDDLITRFKDYKTIRQRILSDLVNSKNLYKEPNSYIDKVWAALNKRFPS